MGFEGAVAAASDERKRRLVLDETRHDLLPLVTTILDSIVAMLVR